MLIAWHLCNYLKVNFGNLLDRDIFKFNNDLVNNVHDSNMVTYKINLWTN
jgi:hypothetical protein